MVKMLKKLAIVLTAAVTVSMCGTAAGAIESPWAVRTDGSDKNSARTAASSTSSTASDKENIRLSRKSVEMTAGDRVSIRLTGAEGTVKWTVSDPKVFTYSKGVITAKSAGRGTLTAEYGGKKYKCTVTVNAGSAGSGTGGFGADVYSLNIPKGGSKAVKISTAGKSVAVMADNANICSVKCSAIVNNVFDLTVTAKKNGKCNITVYDVNNKKSSFTIKLTVSGTADASDAKAVTGGQRQEKADTSDYIDEVIRLCNKEREAAGLAPLEKSDSLTGSAAVRVGELSAKFSHTRPDGSDCFSAITEEGSTFGENIAHGYRTPQQAMEGWLASPGHKENILNPGFTKIGVGYNKDGNYWVQVFAG